MTAIDTARALIAQHIVTGLPRSITIAEVKQVLDGLADAVDERAPKSGAVLTGAQVSGLSSGATGDEVASASFVMSKVAAVSGISELAKLQPVFEASRLLRGENGIAFDFLAREVLINDHSNVLTASGRPSSLLTVSRASSATCFNRSRLLETVGNNVLRYDHHPLLGTPRGLRVDGAHTNLCTRSEPGTGWTQVNLSLTAAAGLDVSGQSKATRLTRTGTNGYVSFSIAKAASAITYCLSFVVEKEVDDFVSITVQGNGSGQRISRRLSFSAGTFVNTQAAGSFVDIDGGIVDTIETGRKYRCWVAFTTDAHTGLTLFAAPTLAALSAVDLHDAAAGATCLLSDVVLHTGQLPGPIVRTAGATATQLAENISINTSAFPFDISNFTMIAEFERAYAAPSGTYPAIAALTNASLHYSSLHTSALLGRTAEYSGTFNFDMTAGTITLGQPHRIAVAARGATEARSMLNGVAGGTDNSRTVPTMTSLDLGHRTGASHMGGWLRKLAVINRAMTDAEIATRMTAMTN